MSCTKHSVTTKRLETLELETVSRYVHTYIHAGVSYAINNTKFFCTKYVVLASMLSLSDINPFAAREAKVFSDDKEIVAMSDLRMCLEKNDLSKFERTIRYQC